MKPSTKLAIEKFLNSTIESCNAVAGGCINESFILGLKYDRQLFAKCNTNAPREMFVAEAAGLNLLRQTETVCVPEVIGIVTSEKTNILLLEAIDIGKVESSFFEMFGNRLAEMHRTTQSAYGLKNDNYLGTSLQRNGFKNDWLEFWQSQRLGYQFSLARDNGYADGEFHRLAELVVNRASEILKTDEPPALIHGDLWRGNFLADAGGSPVLIDPAVYFAHREAEFGMTTLFGGFDQTFYDAYNEAWPFPDGSQERIEIYRLYHLLNHLNLFGRGYLGECLAIMKKYA